MVLGGFRSFHVLVTSTFRLFSPSSVMILSVSLSISASLRNRQST